MKDGIFRQYDIRGIVGDELLIEHTYDLTRAIAFYFTNHAPEVKTIAVGMDARTHSADIHKEVVRGLVDSGLDVISVGECPSPALYFALEMLPVQAGLMITASHNPKEYNGIKIRLKDTSVWGEQIQEIKQLYKNQRYVSVTQQGDKTVHPIIDEYVAWLAEKFAHLKGMQLSAMIDCANGAAGMVMPKLVEAMQWPNVQLLFPEVDGNFPNHEADPTVAKNMEDLQHVLATTDISVGIGLDGDCDRMASMTKGGFLVPGDMLLAVFAQSIIKKHPGMTVVFDIKASSGLVELLKQWGARPLMTPSGHAIISENMRQHNAVLAGELSCHFFFKDRYFGFDDGIYAAMRLLELLNSSGKSLEELISIFPKKYSSREYRVKCEEEQKQTIINQVLNTFKLREDAEVITVDGVRATVPYGWGIVRASNTQPVLSIRFESDSEEGLVKIKQDFFEAMKSYFDESWLKEQLEL